MIRKIKQNGYTLKLLAGNQTYAIF